MLVLTRKEGESVVIYPAERIDETMTVRELFIQGPIKVSIAKIAGQVKLGIDAPPVLKVLRTELASALSSADAHKATKPGR
jgi:sRNA-binding carbon storage regulator CsrA